MEQMVAEPKRTKMVQDKKVKIKTVTAIHFIDETGKEKTIGPGLTVDVSEEVAKEFCDRVFTGSYSFSGERDNAEDQRHSYKRAERV
jgi:hypothetical protein